MQTEIRILSGMAKVFADGIDARYSDIEGLRVLKGQQAVFQVALRADERQFAARLRIAGAEVAFVRTVEYVPVQMPVGERYDADYLRDTPGLYPDMLPELPEGGLITLRKSWQSVLIGLKTDEPGEKVCMMSVEDLNGIVLATKDVALRVERAPLPPQTLKYTRWFHCDALAEVYGVEVFSPAHWRLMARFLQEAAKQGMNMVLTPIHTPPLDTRIGAERRTVQLVEIAVDEKGYHFGFDKLDRFIAMAKAAGMRYFEMAHLYTQWGAKAAPKIVAKVNGEDKRIFGWDTPAVGGEYAEFLKQYLTALVAHLRALGVAQDCIFHISDEPVEADLHSYMAARMQVEPYLEGLPIMDALSHVELYRKGAVMNPIPANDAIEPFLLEAVPERWTYYCCGQTVDVANSFIAMPGERTRILGVQLYREDIRGFLQWGLNYYYNQHSGKLIHPMLTTDGECTWPAGDPFNLYPGADQRPIPSLRSVLMGQALEDQRALQCLEALTDRAHVEALIDEVAGMRVTMSRYPRTEKFLLELMNRVCDEIAAHV